MCKQAEDLVVFWETMTGRRFNGTRGLQKQAAVKLLEEYSYEEIEPVLKVAVEAKKAKYRGAFKYCPRVLDLRIAARGTTFIRLLNFADNHGGGTISI